MSLATIDDIYKEYQMVIENFKLEDGVIKKLKGGEYKEVGKSPSVRVGTKILKLKRVQWILDNRQPIPENGFIRILNDKLICYHQHTSHAGTCECGHSMMLKDYITEECFCSRCYKLLDVRRALPGDRCGSCNGFLIMRSGVSGCFLGCSNITSRVTSCRYVCLLSKAHAIWISEDEL